MMPAYRHHHRNHESSGQGAEEPQEGHGLPHPGEDPVDGLLDPGEVDGRHVGVRAHQAPLEGRLGLVADIGGDLIIRSQQDRR